VLLLGNKSFKKKHVLYFLDINRMDLRPFFLVLKNVHLMLTVCPRN
jgi:hypothetical protein